MISCFNFTENVSGKGSNRWIAFYSVLLDVVDNETIQRTNKQKHDSLIMHSYMEIFCCCVHTIWSFCAVYSLWAQRYSSSYEVSCNTAICSMISNLEQMHTPHPCNRHKQNFCWKQKASGVLYMKWNVFLPSGLLVGPQQDFHVLVDVFHSPESFKENLKIKGHIKSFFRRNRNYELAGNNEQSSVVNK